MAMQHAAIIKLCVLANFVNFFPIVSILQFPFLLFGWLSDAINKTHFPPINRGVGRIAEIELPITPDIKEAVIHCLK